MCTDTLDTEEARHTHTYIRTEKKEKDKRIIDEKLRIKDGRLKTEEE